MHAGLYAYIVFHRQWNLHQLLVPANHDACVDSDAVEDWCLHSGCTTNAQVCNFTLPTQGKQLCTSGELEKMPENASIGSRQIGTKKKPSATVDH